MSRIYNPRDILLRPVVSEKSYGLLDEGKYTFIVAPDANKVQIRQAVEEVFRVKVTDGAVRNVLVVTEHDDELSWKSLRNVPFVHVLAEDQLNTYDVLASDFVVFTKAALDALVERGSE